MKRICIVCEGQAEETFIRDVLAPSFHSLNLYLEARLISTSKQQKGGGLNYDRVKTYLCNTLRQDSNLIVTTLFDLYALDKKFPNYHEAQKCNSLKEKLNKLNGALHTDIVAFAACSEERFIPYIQPYEFEALLFSNIESLVGVEQEWQVAKQALNEIRRQAESPEHINNRKDTTPAAHLQKYLKSPSFRKRLHGSRAIAKIGLDCIEQQCQFFAGWLVQLRNLAHK